MDKLAKRKNESLAVGGAIPGLEQSNHTDIVMPRIKASGKRGLFEDKHTDAATAKLECILLTRLKTRAKFNKDNTLECGSKDRVTGDTYGKCLDCSFACMLEQDKDSKDKPSCPLSYTFLLLKKDSSVPYNMILSAKSANVPAKNYISKFLVDRKPLFSVETILSFEEKKSENKKTKEKFTYFSLVLTMGKEVDPKNQEIYHSLLNEYGGNIELDPEMETEKVDMGEIAI